MSEEEQYNPRTDPEPNPIRNIPTDENKREDEIYEALEMTRQGCHYTC